MTMRIRAVLVALLAAASLGLLVGRAGATEAVAFEPARSISASGTLAMAVEFVTIRCPVTLSGSFTTGSLATTRGTQWGSISRFTWSTCTGGELRAALSLPWALRFRSVPAEYPSEARSVTLDLNGVSLQGTSLFSTCLYSGTVGQQVGLSPEGTYEEAWSTGSDTVLAEERLSLVSGAGCPSTARMSGTLSLTPQQNMQRFFGRLGMNGAVIPAGLNELSVIMANVSPVGFPSVRIGTSPLAPLELVRLAGDDANMFRIKEERNFCQGETLPAGSATVCTTDVRYIETAARPRRVHLHTAWEDGVENLARDWLITANG